MNFNPRSHERSDPIPTITIPIKIIFQSTLPREERLTSQHIPQKAKIISIHAPTRGATVSLIVLFMIGGNFNPRSHERSDTNISACQHQN